jgi:transglutaminase-like putative cysteine protease
MNRPDPFDPNDGMGTGTVFVHPDGLVDKVYNLWNRDPVQVSSAYLSSNGTSSVPRSRT